MPDGVFNHVVSLTKLKEFGKLHHVLASRRQCHAHWENNLRQYAHHTEPLFDEFSSVEALRWALFKRKIDARNWELHITQKDHYGKDKHKSLTHKESFTQVCEKGNLIQFGDEPEDCFIKNKQKNRKIFMRKKKGSYVLDVEFVMKKENETISLGKGEITVDSAAEESVCPIEWGAHSR